MEGICRCPPELVHQVGRRLRFVGNERTTVFFDRDSSESGTPRFSGNGVRPEDELREHVRGQLRRRSEEKSNNLIVMLLESLVSYCAQ